MSVFALHTQSLQRIRGQPLLLLVVAPLGLVQLLQSPRATGQSRGNTALDAVALGKPPEEGPKQALRMRCAP